MKGTVKFFKTDKGYGFIETEDGSKDLFVHIKSCKGVNELRTGDRVSFQSKIGRQGKPEAVNVEVIG